MSIYKVNKIAKNKLEITGQASHDLWAKANVIDGISSFWVKGFEDKTNFKALWDGDFFYFSFTVADGDVHLDRTDNTKASTNNSDRVELFFKVDDSLNPYYCMEIDPMPRLMDFKALPNKEFDFNWNWPKGEVEIKSSMEEAQFVVEGKISISSLRGFDLIKENKMQVGVYRAKYEKQADGTYETTWLTWVDPKTEEPNFHIASSFGEFHLEEY